MSEPKTIAKPDLRVSGTKRLTFVDPASVCVDANLALDTLNPAQLLRWGVD
jgi:hypothetical protein